MDEREQRNEPEHAYVRKSTSLDNSKPFQGEQVVQRYPSAGNERPRYQGGFKLMKTTGTCMTQRDEYEVLVFYSESKVFM